MRMFNSLSFATFPNVFREGWGSQECLWPHGHESNLDVTVDKMLVNPSLERCLDLLETLLPWSGG